MSTKNKDFETLDEVIKYLTILFDDWKEDNELYLGEKVIKEEQEHFNNAIDFIKENKK